MGESEATMIFKQIDGELNTRSTSGSRMPQLGREFNEYLPLPKYHRLLQCG